ncbi:deleted in malignant brain tumors 1 protein-like isoform X4 [Alosa sapidissima]|uniref:deleted in malignant brain tumors 1 protein-like isoform X4 n=1 Tax=Alosa sapidissima TaxID=34773 RepID=UPI001C08177B|nr:deleted in malignant brain tumors 1 protein-like isoform X4 [Alosa sapidissima]
MGEMSMSMAVLALVSVISVSVPSAPVAAQIRLVNGKSRCSGRVEVYLSNQWGTVCDDGWDMSDAEVVCRELGCGCAINAPWSAFYGAGTGYILMDDVACSLTEQSLTQCSYNSNPDCKHEEDVGVACTATGPSISLISSYSTVSAGETVQIRCSRSASRCNGNLLLYRNGVNVNSKALNSSQSSATFTLSNVDSSHQGSYTCAYSSSSTHSRSINITVVVLVQPNISLSAPDGGLFWGPQGPEVTRGHSLSLICSSEPQHQGGSFHLIFDGSNRTRTQLAINHSASFYIPEADYSHQGNYSCVYEVTVSSRTFNSTQTAPLTVIVRASLAPIIASGVISGLFLLLLIPAILYLVKKKHLGSANTYRFHNGPGESRDEGENIYIYGDLEEDMNVEELHGPTVIDNDYDEDD